LLSRIPFAKDRCRWKASPARGESSRSKTRPRDRHLPQLFRPQVLPMLPIPAMLFGVIPGCIYLGRQMPR